MVGMDTRTALLDSAEHLARTRGFDAFSYADLSEQVGIRKASIHYHFATKQALADALVKRYAARIADQLAAIDDEHPTGAGRLRAYLDLYREALDQGRQLCLCVTFSAARDSFGPETLAQLNAFHDMSLAWLARTFELGAADGTIQGPLIDPREEAQASLALVEGAQLIARAAADPVRFDQSLQSLVARLQSAPDPSH